MTKLPWNVVALIITISVLGTISWLGRYAVVGMPPGGAGSVGSMYRVDRWTGEIVFVLAKYGEKIKITESGATTP